MKAYSLLSERERPLLSTTTEGITMDELGRHLYDTIVLLGGRPDIANLVLCPDLVDESALTAVKQYNIELQESVKDRLINMNKTEIQPNNEGRDV